MANNDVEIGTRGSKTKGNEVLKIIIGSLFILNVMLIAMVISTIMVSYSNSKQFNDLKTDSIKSQ